MPSSTPKEKKTIQERNADKADRKVGVPFTKGNELNSFNRNRQGKRKLNQEIRAQSAENSFNLTNTTIFKI